uniref:Uncharacterized protein n=1 Tax=Trichogramma kaykai TaxID=54128 RepID=A0ABD2W1F8_9HYME
METLQQIWLKAELMLDEVKGEAVNHDVVKLELCLVMEIRMMFVLLLFCPDCGRVERLRHRNRINARQCVRHKVLVAKSIDDFCV